MVLQNALVTIAAFRQGVAPKEDDVINALEVVLRAAVSGQLPAMQLSGILDPSLMKLLYESEPQVLLYAGRVLPESLFSSRIERKLIVRGDLRSGAVTCEAHRAFFLIYESLGLIPKARLTRKMFDLLQSTGEKWVLLQLPLFFPLEYARPILEMFLCSGSAKDVAYLAERVPNDVFEAFGERLIHAFLERATTSEVETAFMLWPRVRCQRLKLAMEEGA